MQPNNGSPRPSSTDHGMKLTVQKWRRQMSQQERPPPFGWSDDQLTEYLNECRGNQFATYANKEMVRALIRNDLWFRRVLKEVVNPRPFFPMSFMLRAHSAYLAACGCIMAGQTYEANAILRSCLEIAAYGFYIGADDERAALWLSRHDSDAMKIKVRSEFSQGNIRRHIRSADQKLADIYDSLYEDLIDFGAHPNERGFSASTTITEGDGAQRFSTIYLQGDGEALDLSLKWALEVGLWVLHIFERVYPAKFALLGVSDELKTTRRTD